MNVLRIDNAQDPQRTFPGSAPVYAILMMYVFEEEKQRAVQQQDPAAFGGVSDQVNALQSEDQH